MRAREIVLLSKDIKSKSTFASVLYIIFNHINFSGYWMSLLSSGTTAAKWQNRDFMGFHLEQTAKIFKEAKWPPSDLT